jgi:hypothetical protein
MRLVKEIRIDHPHNEASALTAIHDHALLEAWGWDAAFWIVSDEKPARKALAALGRHGDGTWSVVPLRTTLTAGSDEKPAEDCETLTRAGSFIYVFGSQYGSKEGPLEPRRHFVARFNESLVRKGKKALHADLDLARAPFVLHRLINDALRERGIDLLEHDDSAELDVRKKWKKLVHDDDRSINVEGSTFLPNGHLLLGLRYPVTADGHPLLVEIERIDRLFEGKTPEVASVWIVENVGTAKAPAGIRELDARGAAIHLISGDIDDPKIGRPPGEHHKIVARPQRGSAIRRVEAQRIRTFRRGQHVEGIAVMDDGTVWYAYDDEQIRLAVGKLR